MIELKGHNTESLNLELEEDQCVLYKKDGTVVRRFSVAQANKLFRMPSFIHNIKYLGIRITELAELIEFKASQKGIKEITHFLDSSYLEAEPEGLNELRKKSFRSLFLGIFSTLLSIGVIYIVMYLETKGYEWNPAFLFLGLFLGGIALIVNSIRERIRLIRLTRIVEIRGFPHERMMQK